MRALQRFVEVHADFDQTKESPNHGSRGSQSRLVHISIKTRAQFGQLSSTIPSGYNRDRTEFEHGSIQVKAKLNQGPCAIQAGCDWSLSEAQTRLDRNSNEDRSEFELSS